MTITYDDAYLRQLLSTAHTIAVVGLSPQEDKASFRVASYLLTAGYTVIPVNPAHTTILGQTCYPDLHSIPCPIDIVDIFRRPEHVLPFAQQAISCGAGALWMQLGIRNDEAAHLATEHSLQVVMDRCIKIEHHRLFT